MSDNGAYDFVIVGAGVIGLTIAYRLANDGARVCVVDRRDVGREASWAGTGILPPGAWYSDHPSLEHMAAWSMDRYPEFCKQLREASGIDPELVECGGVYLIDSVQGGQVARKIASWSKRGVACEPLDVAALRELAPTLRPPEDVVDRTPAAWLLHAEKQVRNPRLLKALYQSCLVSRVAIHQGEPVHEVLKSGDRIEALVTSGGRRRGGHFVFAAGCWTGRLAAQIACRTPTIPIRGQVVMLEQGSPTLRHNLHYQGRYIATRSDGRVLIGSTTERNGFDKAITLAAGKSLTRFASQLVPNLGDRRVESRWVGLRPGTMDELPYIGRAPDTENAWIATGHFRAGLQLAPATAEAIVRLIRGKAPVFGVDQLAPDRHVSVQATG